MTYNKIYLSIPRERIRILLGEKGRVKEVIEKLLNVKINVLSDESDVGSIIIESSFNCSSILKARDIVAAIGYGLNPDQALKLIEDDYIALFISISDQAPTIKNLKRIKGRIIGENGKSKRNIEELTKTFIAIDDISNTIVVIGKYENAMLARDAIIKLINGAEHGSVYKFIKRKACMLM
jgi:ribosomal RNA assembly protein